MAAVSRARDEQRVGLDPTPAADGVIPRLVSDRAPNGLAAGWIPVGGLGADEFIVDWLTGHRRNGLTVVGHAIFRLADIVCQKNENRVVLRPKDPYGTITEFNLGGLREQLNRAEFNGPSPDPGVRSAFAKKLTPEASPSPVQGASLYGRAASTPSPTVSTTVAGAGLDPRRAAPPAASRWWLAGQGQRPGIKEQRNPTRLVNIRPTDLGGRRSPVSSPARGVRGRPRRAGGCRSCRCRRTCPIGCGTDRPASRGNRGPRKS